MPVSRTKGKPPAISFRKLFWVRPGLLSIGRRTQNASLACVDGRQGGLLKQPAAGNERMEGPKERGTLGFQLGGGN
jgi:hypothetical protein